MTLELRTLTDVAALDAILPAWEDLARRRGHGFVSRPSYALTWWKELGKGELAVVTGERDGQLVAVAPLHRRTLLGQPVLRWLGHGLGTVGEVLVEDVAAAAELWSGLAEDGAALQLTHVRLDDPATLALRRSRAWQVALEVDDRVPVTPLPDGIRSGDLRTARSLKRLQSYRRGLERDGRPFAVELVTDVNGLRRRWPDIVRVAADADQGRGRENLCAPPYDAFSRSFLEQEAARGTLLVMGGTAGGRWVAHAIFLRHGPQLELWLTRYDPELEKVGLGHLLTEELVDRHEELGVGCLDFGIGENDYKGAWSRSAYDVGTLTASPLRLRRAQRRLALAGTAGELARRVRR